MITRGRWRGLRDKVQILRHIWLRFHVHFRHDDRPISPAAALSIELPRPKSQICNRRYRFLVERGQHVTD
jgi:hypothetical protein